LSTTQKGGKGGGKGSRGNVSTFIFCIGEKGVKEKEEAEAEDDSCGGNANLYHHLPIGESAREKKGKRRAAFMLIPPNLTSARGQDEEGRKRGEREKGLE